MVLGALFGNFAAKTGLFQVKKIYSNILVTVKEEVQFIWANLDISLGHKKYKFDLH